MTSASPEHKAADGTAVQAGQSWAYRARRGDALTQVTVVRLGAQRPARALVTFADEAFEGRQEWVPPARLKARWEHVDEFRAREARWDRIEAAGLSLDDSHEDAAQTVIELLLSDDGVQMGYREFGAVRLRDPVSVATRLGLEPGQLTGHPIAFTENEVLIAPWDVTELIVGTAARLNPGPLLEHLAQEEREARRAAIHGRWYRGRGGRRDSYIEPEWCAETDNDYSRPRRDILRTWCGAEATDRFGELAELRKEVRRIGEVAQSAINALRAAGRKAEADVLQRDLGIPLDVLRGTDQSGGSEALMPRGMNLSNSDGSTSSGTR
jgi:hypothetical protein